MVRAQKRTVVPVPVIPSELPDFSISKGTGVIKELSADVWKLYLEFVRQSNVDDVLAMATPRAPTFMAPAIDIGGFKTWSDCARDLMTDLLPRLPIQNDRANDDDNGILGLIRLFCDRLHQRRSPQYDAEYRFLSKHRIKSKLHQLGGDDVTRVQQAVVEELKGVLTKCLSHQQELGRDEWLRSLVHNPWRQPLDKQLVNAYQRFVTLPAKAIWKTTGTPVFREASNSEIANNANELFETIEQPTTLDVWKRLFLFAKCVTRCTIDCLSGGNDAFCDEVREIIKKKRPDNPEPNGATDLHEELEVEIGKDCAGYFQTLFAMRNRDAHPDDPRQKKDWNRIQKFVAKLLGRRWSPSKELQSPNQLFQPDDLQLTSLEGCEVKLQFLRGICAGLEKLQPNNNGK